MSTPIDTGLLELLASKICHDLISPIGAVNNGIEFLTEMGADAGDEVTDLIAFSASQASAKLKAYRMAYGAGGADDSIKPEEAHQAIQDIVGAEKKITQSWDPYGDLGYEDRPKAFCKMLVCALLLGMDCLPKGGTLSVGAGANANLTLVSAKGPDASIREGNAAALNLSMPRGQLEPKYVHAYITGVLAEHYGYKLSVTKTGDDSVEITMQLPAA
ncbi:MAG: hypothetical protein H6861_01755 [Rhodospirillales bacterium]|nr:hypothetical protein [Rhodospirillales bacterium]